MPYLTPETIPADTICRVLFIPNEREIIANVTGALQELSYVWNWEQSGAITPQEMADRMFEMCNQFSLTRGTCRMIGEVVAFAASTSPSENWLLCNGDSYLRDEYPDLFNVIGTVFGAVDITHFNVPDMRGRVIMGTGPGFAFSADGGEQNATITIDSMPSHDHAIDHYFTALALAPGELPVLIPDPFVTVTGLTGGDQEHNNLQPFLVLNYFIVAKE